MKSQLFFALSICLSLAPAGLFLAVAAELPPTGVNSISGQLSFANTDPDILARLGPPGFYSCSSRGPMTCETNVTHLLRSPPIP
jgi:hypothetical protein